MPAERGSALQRRAMAVAAMAWHGRDARVASPRVTHLPASPIGSRQRENEGISTALAASAPLGPGGAGVRQGGSGATAAPRRQGAFQSGVEPPQSKARTALGGVSSLFRRPSLPHIV